MFHDGHSDPIEGGILMREKKQTPGREKSTRNEIFKKAMWWSHRAPAQDQLGERNGLGAELSVILTEEVQVKFLLRQRVEEGGL